MQSDSNIPRRAFIKVTAFSGIGLVLGVSMLDKGDREVVNLSGVKDTSLNPFIIIDNQGQVTILNHRPEMGQGTFQSIPMIIAEELEVDIDKIVIRPSEANHEKYGDQMVVGSRSISGNFEWMRKVGASAREMLIAAAASAWNVSPTDCYAEQAKVWHRPSGKNLSYGELASQAARMEVPKEPRLKDPKDFKIIGKSTRRSDIPSKINGQAQFGIDCEVPGMLYASIERSPLFLAKLVRFDDTKAKQIPGVRYVLKTKRNVVGHDREGVAVLADNYWAAYQGRKALVVEWDSGGLDNWSTEKIDAFFNEGAKEDAAVFESNGNFDNAFKTAKHQVEASYSTPYQTHAPMEPMNALVFVEKDRCTYWGSTQSPNGFKSQLARQCHLPEDRVTVHYTFMGGGFGRRSMPDVVEEAADLSMQTGKPVKVIWSREDDLTQGPFRACSLNICRGAVDEQGNLLALEHKVICQEIHNQTGNSQKAGEAIAGGINTAYAIPDYRICGVLRKLYIPIYYWRSVYHSTNCFAHESFVDELARAAGKDPLDFRLSLLKNHRRFTKVLEIAAEKTGWHKPKDPQTGRGVAIVERSGAFVAMVAEVEKSGGQLQIRKMTAVIDSGRVVNPDILKEQTEGCIVMGLTASIMSGLKIEKGEVAQKNFNTYKMLLMEGCPPSEVFVVESEDPPEGGGEPGLPPVAPALTNAIFDLTGKRIRKLPFNLGEV